MGNGAGLTPGACSGASVVGTLLAVCGVPGAHVTARCGAQPGAGLPLRFSFRTFRVELPGAPREGGAGRFVTSVQHRSRDLMECLLFQRGLPEFLSLFQMHCRVSL